MKLNHIFWWVAGADRNKMEKCPSDQKKMGAIGMVILMTSIVAFFAGTAAALFFTEKDGATSGNVGWSIAFGILWAIIIFIIDRSLVVTMKKDPTSPHPRKSLIGPFIFRIFLAFIISLMISSPLELFIFEGYLKTARLEFEKEQAKVFVEDQQSEINQLDTLDAGLRGAIGRNETKMGKLESEIATNNAKITSLEKQLGHPTSTKYQYAKNTLDAKRESLNRARRGMSNADTNQIIRDIGTQQRIIKEEVAAWNKRINNQIADLKNDNAEKREEVGRLGLQNDKSHSYLDSNYTKRIRLEQDRNTNRTKYESEQTNASRFFRDYRALHRTILQTENRHLKNPTELLFYLVIWGIFFLIELLPTLVKFITPVCAYDWLAHEEEVALKDYFISPEYHDAVKELQREKQQHESDVQQEQLSIDRETKSEIMKKVSQAQQDVADEAIKHWKEQKMQHLSPDTIYGTDSSTGSSTSDDDSFVSMA